MGKIYIDESEKMDESGEKFFRGVACVRFHSDMDGAEERYKSFIEKEKDNPYDVQVREAYPHYAKDHPQFRDRVLKEFIMNEDFEYAVFYSTKKEVLGVYNVLLNEIRRTFKLKSDEKVFIEDSQYFKEIEKPEGMIIDNVSKCLGTSFPDYVLGIYGDCFKDGEEVGEVAEKHLSMIKLHMMYENNLDSGERRSGRSMV